MTLKGQPDCAVVVASRILNRNSGFDRVSTSFPPANTWFHLSYARNLVRKDLKSECTTFTMTADCIAPGAALPKRQSELMSTSPSGTPRDSDRVSCCINS